jgi:predicted cupin superfamily sugar epimerase
MTAAEIIEQLGLVPHPEGGHYIETWRHAPSEGGRGAGTSIYFLLQRDEVSHWHRCDSHEQWHFYDGAALELSVSIDGVEVQTNLLGRDIAADQRPQRDVPAGAWQSARSLGEWTLVGCTVSPAFEFDSFELAPPGWKPGSGDPQAAGRG